MSSNGRLDRYNAAAYTEGAFDNRGGLVMNTRDCEVSIVRVYRQTWHSRGVVIGIIEDQDDVQEKSVIMVTV